MPEVTWFVTPTPRRSGTLNAAYQLLDARVVAGEAEELVVRGRTVARLLEDSAAFAGALRGLGCGPGGRVLVDVADPGHAVVALLAVARLGAVVVEQDAPLVVGDHPTAGDHRSAIVREADPADLVEGRDLSWEVAVRAGRTDPAPAEPMDPQAPADDRGTTVRDLAERLAVRREWTVEELVAAFLPG